LLQPTFTAICVAVSCLFLIILLIRPCCEAESLGAIACVAKAGCYRAVLCRDSWCVVDSSTARCKEVRISIIEKILSEKGRQLRHPVTVLLTMLTMMLFVCFDSRTITKMTLLQRSSFENMWADPAAGYTASSKERMECIAADRRRLLAQAD
jgi:hypothetical protein